MALAAVVIVAGGGYYLVRMRSAITPSGGAAKAATGPLAATPGVAKGFNVVLVTLDTTRADRLGCYGYKNGETPNLDGLAAGGVRFADAVTVVPMTLPAHASIMTGRYPPNTGVRDNGTYRLADTQDTLAKLLQSKGYATAAFIAAFVLDRRYGLNQGFDTYDDDITLKYRQQGVRQAMPQRPADAVVNSALSWLEEFVRKGSRQPFFMWVHLFDPHTPYAPPAPFRTKFAKSLYDGEVAFMDQQVGRLLERMRERGLVDRTLFVLVGDHGEGLGDHNEAVHSLLIYDSTMRVPLILYAPRIFPRGQVVSDRLAATVDLVPTILDLLGEPLPEVDGESLLRPGQDPDPPVYLETLAPRLNHGWSELYGVRRHVEKFIEAPTPEYYDLQADPGELQNLLPGATSRAQPLRDEYDEFAASFSEKASAEASLTPDADALQKLAALGYVGGQSMSQPAEAGPLPDPKDMLTHGEARLSKARDLVDRGRFAEAVSIIRQSLQESSKDARMWHMLSLAQVGLGQPQDALASRMKTIELQPGDVAHWIQLAHLQRQLGDHATAETTLDQAMAIDSQEGEAYLLRAELAADAGHPDEALKHCAEARQRDPTRHTATSWALQGTLLERMNRMDDARKAFEQAYAADPLDSGALAGLARFAERDGQPERVIELATKLLPGDGAWELSRAPLARAYLRLGRADEALATTQAAVEAMPNSGRAQSDHGSTLYELSRYADAADAFRRAIALEPNVASGHCNLGYSLEALGELDAAAEEFRRTLELQPALPQAKLALARVDVRRGRLDDAITGLESLLSAGVVTIEKIEADPAFAPLVNDERFQQLRAAANTPHP